MYHRVSRSPSDSQISIACSPMKIKSCDLSSKPPLAFSPTAIGSFARVRIRFWNFLIPEPPENACPRACLTRLEANFVPRENGIEAKFRFRVSTTSGSLALAKTSEFRFAPPRGRGEMKTSRCVRANSGNGRRKVPIAVGGFNHAFFIQNQRFKRLFCI